MLSNRARGVMLDALIGLFSTQPVLELRSGPEPESCEAPATGTLLARGTLPASWAGSPGERAKVGEWRLQALAYGEIGYFRIYSGAACDLQDKVTAVGRGGPMEVDSIRVTAREIIVVREFTLALPQETEAGNG